MLGNTRGYTLVDVVFAAGLVAVILATTVPQVAVGMERARGRAAARYLVGQMTLARAQAVGRAATVALRFQPDATGIRLSVVVDGNRNGVLTREVDSGTDRLIQPAVRLEHLFPGVVIGLPEDSEDDPVHLGGTDILSFTPAGTATSGTVYLLSSDGSRFAVRVFGVTARVRLLQFDQHSGGWVESF